MSLGTALPLLVLMSSLLPGVIIFFLPERRHGLRTTLNIGAAVAKLALTAVMAAGIAAGHHFETRFRFVPGADLVLRADTWALMFVVLSAALWLATTIYAVGYLEGTPEQSRFFGFFSLCVASTMGIALAANLVTFFVFYEMLTVTTYPLVIHRGTREALRAGDVYLRYTISGGVALLAGIAFVYALAGHGDFTEGGFLAPLGDRHRAPLIVAFALLVTGLAVKAAIFPLHRWLPTAMVAPAPVSALLHAVAVVKAGAFGITRVLYDVYGLRFARELGVTDALTLAAVVTILFGSCAALAQTDLKRRLAYSTVSQVSYIVLGMTVYGSLSTIGGSVHLIHQGLMKITLFFCAGNVAEELGVHEIRELRGVARRMPLTMAAFTVGALGMIGVPPLAGFVTKWYLGLGALEAGEGWCVVVLLVSSLLNAAYFLPIVYDTWFGEPRIHLRERAASAEVRLSLLLPTLATAALSVAAGVLAGSSWSPLGWAKRITSLELYR